MLAPTPPRIPARHRPRGFSIVHEDAALLVVDKAHGVLTNSEHHDNTGTVEAGLNRYLRKGNPASRARVWVVHRLDRETSGLLVFAKTPAVQEQLKTQWETTRKFYLAIVHGRLAEKQGEISTYLAEDPDQFVHTVAHRGVGKLARTDYTVIRETPALSVLRINLLTGRKNQIRVHFADLGHPVAGDPKYGIKDRFRARMALYARTISFPHPHGGQRVTFQTPIPDYFLELIHGLSDADWATQPDPPAEKLGHASRGQIIH